VKGDREASLEADQSEAGADVITGGTAPGAEIDPRQYASIRSI